MISRYYRFAGLELAITMPEDLMYEKEYRLAPFRVDSVTDPHRFVFEKREQLEAPRGQLEILEGNYRVYRQGERMIRYLGPVKSGWEAAYFRVESEGKENWVQLRACDYPGAASAKTVLDALWVEHLMAGESAFLFHCAYIAWEGQAILFTAPSETGKSTQAELWQKYRGAEIINGDRAAVRLTEKGLVAEGIPFSGSSSYCRSRALPIRAVVYLDQAPQTIIRKLRGYEAFAKIWEGISVNIWDKKDLERVSGVVEMLAATVPVYHMPCTPDEAAVTALEQTLRKQVTL